MGTVIQIFSPSTQERQMQEDIWESKASLIYSKFQASKAYKVRPGLK